MGEKNWSVNRLLGPHPEKVKLGLEKKKKYRQKKKDRRGGKFNPRRGKGWKNA